MSLDHSDWGLGFLWHRLPWAGSDFKVLCLQQVGSDCSWIGCAYVCEPLYAESHHSALFKALGCASCLRLMRDQLGLKANRDYYSTYALLRRSSNATATFLHRHYHFLSLVACSFRCLSWSAKVRATPLLWLKGLVNSAKPTLALSLFPLALACVALDCFQLSCSLPSQNFESTQRFLLALSFHRVNSKPIFVISFPS